MNIAFSGDRNYRLEYFEVLWHYFMRLTNSVHIHVGDCPTGVDDIVRLYAKNVRQWGEKPLYVYKAHWDMHGKMAGPLRNKAMLSNGIDKLVFVHHDILQSRGTANCVKQAQIMNIPVEGLIREPNG